MIDDDEIIFNLLKLTGINFIMPDKALFSINAKINKFFDDEEKELLHLTNAYNINPYENSLPLSYKKIFEGIKADHIPDNDQCSSIISNSEDQIQALFVTHGTRFTSLPSNEYYFFDDKINASSDEYTKDVGKFLKCKYNFYLSWLGNNNHNSRIKASNKIFLSILEKLLDISKVENIDQYSIPITLLGHSHGGNVMIMTANQLIKNGYHVNLLLTLNTPVRPEYNLIFKIPHVNIFSFSDWIQVAGGWDFDSGICDTDYKGPAERLFKNALNLCFDSKIGNPEKDAYQEIKKKFTVTTCIEHQITRWSRFLIRCLTY